MNEMNPLPTGEPIRVLALVDEREQRAVVLGLRLLVLCLDRIQPSPSTVKLNFGKSRMPISLESAPHVIITSLLPDLTLIDWQTAEIAKSWAEDVGRLRASGAAVFVANIFRFVFEPDRRSVTSTLAERIRRLNQIAITLSYEFGIGVIDIDRAMAHFGGRPLRADYRLGSDDALIVAGHAIARSLLSYGLDACIDPTSQEKALHELGTLQRIPYWVRQLQATSKSGERISA